MLPDLDAANTVQMNSDTQFPTLVKLIKSLDTAAISQERKHALKPLIDYIQNKVESNQNIRLNFICTHNSRRSHLSQVWAQTIAAYFDIDKVSAYSGGTEATALFPIVAATLSDQGFKIDKLSNFENPIYAIKYADNEAAIIGFSKRFDHSFNPKSNFAAILTCSSADKGCPFIMGAEERIPILFEDPKTFDNSPVQKEKYLEKSIEIASELFYVFNQINNSI